MIDWVVPRPRGAGSVSLGCPQCRIRRRRDKCAGSPPPAPWIPDGNRSRGCAAPSRNAARAGHGRAPAAPATPTPQTAGRNSQAPPGGQQLPQQLRIGAVGLDPPLTPRSVEVSAGSARCGITPAATFAARHGPTGRSTPVDDRAVRTVRADAGVPAVRARETKVSARASGLAGPLSLRRD
jgi:hypothetical protein